MKVCAIIAEYNPLHNGHLYHIQKTVEKVRPDYIIVIMSGHFTQRGEPTIADKWTRASWALHAGADMVIELPTIYALSSASRFAWGAVEIAKRLRVVTHLSFGSETEDYSAMQKAVDLRSSGELDRLLFPYLKEGHTYAKAVELATKELCPELNMQFFSQSNAILGMEYLHNLQGSPIEPVLVKRTGNSHTDSNLTSPITSATSIRKAVEGGAALAGTTPDYVQILSPVFLQDFDLPIRIALQKLGREGISDLQDVNEGLENRIYSCLQSAKSVETLLSKVKTKRYLYSRLQRIMSYALLSIDKEMYENQPLFARILGMKKDAGTLTNAIKKNATLPVVTKITNANLNESEQQCLAKDILATNLYAEVSPLPGNSDYTHPIVIL